MSAASIHAIFFPPARPICRYTRAELKLGGDGLPRPIAIGAVTVESAVMETPRARARKIASVATSMYGVTIDEVFGRSRRKSCVQARAHVARELRGMGWSYPRIARFLHRDHTTILSLLGRLARNTEYGRRR